MKNSKPCANERPLRLKALSAVLFSATLIVTNPAIAGLKVDTSRVVFTSLMKEARITVSNTGNDEIIAQSWLESDEGNEAAELFVITPPLTRVLPNEKKVFRILYQGTGLANDKESLAWINFQQIPTRTTAPNTLKLAIRQRIKLFFRPDALPDRVEDAVSQLRWSLDLSGSTPQVLIENPGSFYVSMAGLDVKTAHGETLLKTNSMVAPQSTTLLAIPPRDDARTLNIAFLVVDDFGGRKAWQVEVSRLATGQATPANTHD